MWCVSPLPLCYEDVVIQLWNSPACLAVLHSFVLSILFHSLHFFFSCLHLFICLAVFYCHDTKTPPLGKKCTGGRKLKSQRVKSKDRAFLPPSDPTNSVKSLGGGVLPEFALCRLRADMCTNKRGLGFGHIFIQMGSYTACHFAFSF